MKLKLPLLARWGNADTIRNATAAVVAAQRPPAEPRRTIAHSAAVTAATSAMFARASVRSPTPSARNQRAFTYGESGP